jgi:hypothetical protein
MLPPMHNVSSELDQMLNCVDAETARLLAQTVRDAVALAGKRAATASPSDEMGYPVGYFAATAGSFESEPLERSADLPLESRESW